MSNENDPMSNRDLHAIRRECILSRGSIGAGITALGKASYASNMEHYYTSFFGLSIGIERLAKLILIADHAIQNNGVLPNKKITKRYGHDLIKLLDEVEKITTRHNLNLEYERPRNNISTAIIFCLDSFADADRGRYDNFNNLDNQNPNNQLEPIKKWWEDVAEPILINHYIGKKNEQNVQNRAAFYAACMDGLASVRYTNEKGDLMLDIRTASEWTGKTQIVQKFGRFYTLSLVRWMSDVFIKIFSSSNGSTRLNVLFDYSEFFTTFMQSDKYLKSTKRWP